MSTTAGVFSETTLQNIRAMADGIMLDGRTKLNFVPQAEAVNIFSKVQTAKIGELSRKKDYTIEVEWINNCALAVQDCTSCEVGGTELSTNTQTFTIDRCKEVPFSVKGYKFIDNDFDQQEVVAKGLLTADKLICEAIATEVLDWLVTNAGVNVWAAAGEIGTVVGNETQIAAADFDVDALGYIQMCNVQNRLMNPVTLSGRQLYDEFQNAFFATGAFANAGGDQSRFNAMQWLWDLYNFNIAGYNDRMISVSNGAIAFASKSYYGPAVEDYGKEGKRWSMMSRFMPNLVLEVHYNTNCENDIIGEDFNVKARYAFILNPEGCEADNNGILQYVEV